MIAIKIIRNKKRFHHQALVEVKLLDLLRRKVSVILFTFIFSNFEKDKDMRMISFGLKVGRGKNTDTTR